MLRTLLAAAALAAFAIPGQALPIPAHETVISDVIQAHARPRTRTWTECHRANTWGGTRVCRKCWVDTVTRQQQCNDWSNRWGW